MLGTRATRSNGVYKSQLQTPPRWGVMIYLDQSKAVTTKYARFKTMFTATNKLTTQAEKEDNQTNSLTYKMFDTTYSWTNNPFRLGVTRYQWATSITVGNAKSY